MVLQQQEHSTRQRLIEAAGQLFAEKGFNGTSIRQVCAQAKVNLSAVDYHFGGKEGLYASTCIYVLDRRNKAIPLDGGFRIDTSASGRLRAFIQSYMARTCDLKRPLWEQQLIHREMMNPTPIARGIIASTMSEEVQTLKAIIRDIAGSKMDDDQLELCVLSIMGQCHFHAHYRRYKATGLQWPHLLTKTNKDIAEHISRFSLAGIQSAPPGTASGS